MLDQPLMTALPAPSEVREKLGAALREAELLRRLLRLAERAEKYRQCLRAKPSAKSGEPDRAA
jgi:hypothetical protein